MRNLTFGMMCESQISQRLHVVLFNSSDYTTGFMEPEIDLKEVKKRTHCKTKKRKKLSPVITNDYQNAVFFFNLKAKSSLSALEKMVNLTLSEFKGIKHLIVL